MGSSLTRRSLRSWHAKKRGRRGGIVIVTVTAHFYGKVIVPDEPLDLPPHQALILQIQTVGGEECASMEDSVLSWLAANAIDSDALPGDLADRHDHYLYRHPAGDEQR
jgi:hypothetical protein